MEVNNRGSAFGYKIILFIYHIVGHRFVVFILNFVALYYVFFTPSIKKSLRSYYKSMGLNFSNKLYFSHIKTFAISIFDRFASRINPQDFKFEIKNYEVVNDLQEGGLVLLSHVGSWATAAHCLKDQLPPMHIVMRENTQEAIFDVEKSHERYNEQNVSVIDLNGGNIAANIQIGNALMQKNIVSMMVDRVQDKKHTVEVDFLGSKVSINKVPFKIASRLKQPLVAIFVLSTGSKQYDLELRTIKEGSIEDMAQGYMNILEDTLKRHPLQWYNFFEYFNTKKDT